MLDEPLMSAKDIESWSAEIRALKKGEIRSFACTDFWERAKTEMVRRRANAQIRASNALVRWTVILSIFTGLLVAVSVVQTVGPIPNEERSAEMKRRAAKRKKKK
jgi:hypothetical protein